MENLKTAYRTLVLRYSLLQPEVAEKVPALLKVQEEFRRWATEWILNGDRKLPQQNPLKRFAKAFLYGYSVLAVADGGKMATKGDSTPSRPAGVKTSGTEAKRMRPPLIFSAQLRLDKERDVSNGILVDIPLREVKIRKWSGQRGATIVLPLKKSAVKWILERVKEGGVLVLAAVWVGRSKRNHAERLYVALVFRRKVVPMQPRRLLAVDFNALHNGLSWVVTDGRKIVAWGVMRPDVSKILRLQKVSATLERLCAKEDRACETATATKSRIWRLLRNWEDAAVKKLVMLAVQYKAMIIADVPKDDSIRALKESGYSSERKAFLNFGRLRRRLKGLAEWYGILYREERLYSTVCPYCGAEMEELPNRRVRCACGFEAHRDEVPAFWAVKLYPKLVSFSSTSEDRREHLGRHVLPSASALRIL